MKNKIKYFIKKFMFLKALNSPFKPFKLKWYIGKVAIGTPYFFPRKWVSGNHKLINEAVLNHIKKEESYNRMNPNYARKILSYDELYKERRNSSFAIPKKIGFDFVGLGWKTKWNDTDYRFEWSPLISFVFFKWQIAIIFDAPEPDHYWTSWLYYEYNTDKCKSQKERIKQCQEEFLQNWISHSSDGVKTKINYYNFILREKYLIN
jgi:hypothetical protein